MGQGRAGGVWGAPVVVGQFLPGTQVIFGEEHEAPLAIHLQQPHVQARRAAVVLRGTPPHIRSHPAAIILARLRFSKTRNTKCRT